MNNSPTAALAFETFQQDMCRGYACGAPGVAISGLVWIVAAVVATALTPKFSVLVLLVGGALIHPLSILLCKTMGFRGSHEPGNPLARLAIEGTFWLLAGIAIAYGLHFLRIQWFFPAMLLLIGGRYLTFQSLYGLRLYWVAGALLCATGLALALLQAQPALSALTGGAIELALAVLLFKAARNSRNAV